MPASTKTLAYASYAFIAIVWGTTYLAIRIGVAHYPPLLMAGVRQVLAAGIMLAVAYGLNRSVNVTRRNVLQNAAIGFLMISVGNGAVTWAERFVPSGVAALVCSTMPIFVVLLNLMLHGERVNRLIALGMLLGFGGVALIFRADVGALANPVYLAGIGGLLAATFSWGAGSVLSKRWGTAQNPMFDSGMQVLFGGLFLLLFSPAVDDYATADWYSVEAFWCFLYLVVFGSVIAFTAYRYALKALPVGFVTSYAYINPLVAVILGAFWGEPTSIWTALAFAAILLGVFLVKQGYSRQQAADAKPS